MGIAHPERSATLLALPMRAFMWVIRPLLRAVNSMANAVLRRVGAGPTDQVAAAQDSSALTHPAVAFRSTPSSSREHDADI